MLLRHNASGNLRNSVSLAEARTGAVQIRSRKANRVTSLADHRRCGRYLTAAGDKTLFYSSNVFSCAVLPTRFYVKGQSNNKHSVTHHSIYLFCTLHHFTPRLCQYATCFGSAGPSSSTCMNVKTQIFNQII
jgi:hypothetical protein